MNETKTAENQTKKLVLQRIIDTAIIALVSVVILSIYEDAWLFEHSSKANMIAIHFNMFEFYSGLVVALLMFVLPYAFDFFSGRNIMYKYTSEKQMPTKLGRILKIVIVSLFIVLCSVMFTDKYSRVEFYDNGSIVEYNRHNQVENEYTESDIDYVLLKINHSNGRHVSYWTEAVIHISDNEFILREANYIAPDNDEFNYRTERSLYGLGKIKEVFSDKIIINTETLDILFEVEHYNYTKSQAEKLCKIYEVNYDEMMLYIKERWDIVLND